MHKSIYQKYKAMMVFIIFAAMSSICVAGQMENAIAAISAIGSTKDIANGNEANITTQAAALKSAGNSDIEAQLAQIEANYKSQIDASTLTHNHDPLKSDLSNIDASNSGGAVAEDIKKITNKSLDASKRFKIAKNDELLMVAQDIEAKTIIEKGDIVTPSSLGSDVLPLEDRIVTCREAGDEVIKKCYRTLIVKAVQPEDIKFTVELNFMAHSYSGHHTTVDLKNGKISSGCANNSNSRIVNSFAEKAQGAQILSVRNFKSQSQGHTQDVNYSIQQPTAANNYIYSCNIIQGSVGSRVKSRHRHNRNQNRGRIESWEVVARPAPVLVESWDDGGCAKLADFAGKDFCEGPVINLLEAGVTKSIPGYPTPVTRSHWQEEHIYSCGGGSIANGCANLFDAGCTQIDSMCIKTKGPFCVEYLQTFNCGKKNIISNLKCDGTKMTISQQANIGANDGFDVEDFGNAVAQLSMVEELKKNIMRDGDGTVLLFKGDRLTCDKDWGSDIKNCCNLKGIFKNIIGHKCPKDVEEILAPAVIRQKRCVEVAGWQCIAKTLGKCRKWRKSFCCYQGRLARIFQQIAHNQLGISWGSAEHPNCGPLDPHTFGRLNFDEPFARNLLKELVDEVSVNAQKYANKTDAKLANNADLSDKVKALQDRIGAYYESKTNNVEKKP